MKIIYGLKVFALILLVSIFSIGCDRLIEKAGAEAFRIGIREKCGDEDLPCKKAVDEKFPACQQKYEKEWKAYLDADEAKEDEPLRIYSEKMYSCIVDSDGNPYFKYDPE